MSDSTPLMWTDVPAYSQILTSPLPGKVPQYVKARHLHNDNLSLVMYQ